MDSHASLAWKSMQEMHGGERAPWGCPGREGGPEMLRMIMTHMRHCVRGTLAAGATVLLVAAPWVAASSAAAAAVPRAAGHGRKKVHDPGRVTGTIHGHCSYRD